MTEDNTDWLCFAATNGGGGVYIRLSYEADESF
jgi:hypothetical protein